MNKTQGDGSWIKLLSIEISINCRKISKSFMKGNKRDNSSVQACDLQKKLKNFRVSWISHWNKIIWAMYFKDYRFPVTSCRLSRRSVQLIIRKPLSRATKKFPFPISRLKQQTMFCVVTIIQMPQTVFIYFNDQWPLHKSEKRRNAFVCRKVRILQGNCLVFMHLERCFNLIRRSIQSCLSSDFVDV